MSSTIQETEYMQRLSANLNACIYGKDKEVETVINCIAR